MFDSIYGGTTLDVTNFMYCLIASLVLGFLIALFYTFRCKYTKSFVMTLATMPCAVAMVIAMVNGNIGAGVAVAGAFSLVRFRSVPGTAREIGAIFIAMGAGLAIGMGYIGIAFVFSILVSIVNMLIVLSPFGDEKINARMLKITIPEDLNYTTAFNDIFKEYCSSYKLTLVKSTNMGSLFKLSYDLELINSEKEKEFLDELRVRNGNLDIIISMPVTVNEL